MDTMLTVRGQDVLDFLNGLIQEATVNVASYEDYDGEKFNLANFRSMEPWDSFLYGIATGKKDQVEYLYTLVEAKLRSLR